MKHMFYRIVIYLALMVLIGCAHTQPRSKEVPPTREQSCDQPKEQARSQPHEQPNVTSPQIVVPPACREHGMDDELLGYAKRFGELSADSQKKENTQVIQSLARNKNDLVARIKTALIAALPASRYRDDARALGLLGDIQRDKLIEDDIRALAAILMDYVEEHQKLEDSAAKLQQKAKDEQKRADELQQKLDELKNIEKTLIERTQTPKK